MSEDEERGLLTRAVWAIREEWSDRNGGAWHQVQRFHTEVANWLEIQAECEVEEAYEGEWDRTQDLGWQSGLRIARAYLEPTP